MARILTVEDSIHRRQEISAILRTNRHEVLEAANGRLGLDVVAAQPVDCSVLDLIMPEMGGIEVLQKLRGQHSSMPVIVLTADIQKPTCQECKDLGVAGFVNKPAQRDQLLGVIAKVLASGGEHGKTAP